MRIFLIFLFIISLGNIQAQTTMGASSLNPRYIIKTNPLAMIVGPMLFASEYRISIENTTAINQSVQFGISYLGQNSILKSTVEQDTSFKSGEKIILQGYRLQFSYRFFFKNEAPNGFYIAPNISYSYAKMLLKVNHYVQKNPYVRLIYFNYGAIFGYQKIVTENIVVDMFLGGGYKKNTYDQVYFYGSSTSNQILKNKTKPLDKEGLYMFGENLKLYLGFNIGYAF